jgi:predicted DNA-binding transcriptional regulator AlpA
MKWLRAWLAARGVDPASIPEPPFHIVRLPELRDLTGLSTATLYRLMNEPGSTFPASIPLDRDISQVVPMRRLQQTGEIN